MASVRTIEGEYGVVAVDNPGRPARRGDDAVRPGRIAAVTARSRKYSFPGRDHGVHPRFTVSEYAELVEAAARAGLTPTGYVGEAALAAARGLDQDGHAHAGGITRAELAQLQRDLFAARTALNQAAAGLRQAPTGADADEVVASCARSVAALDAAVDRIHRQLWQAASPAGDPQP